MGRHPLVPCHQNRSTIFRLQLTNPPQKPFTSCPFDHDAQRSINGRSGTRSSEDLGGGRHEVSINVKRRLRIHI